MDFGRELDLLIRSRYPLLFIPTPEEQRVEEAIQAAAGRIQPPRNVLFWDFIEGFVPGGSAKEDPLQALEVIKSRPTDQSWIFVLRDFHRFLDDTRVLRKLRNLVRSLRAERKTIVLLSPFLKVPEEILREDVTVVDFPLPSYQEIALALETTVHKDKVRLDAAAREALVKACQGLSMQRIERVLGKAVAKDGLIDESDIALVLEEKKQKIKQTEVLEFYPTSEHLADIGGLDNLKQWLNLRTTAFSDKARRYGLPNPRGVLLVGIQGTGKSLSAKAIAQHWRLPLLRLDVGRLMGSLVGESEAKAREMIRLAEAMAPAVLWMDELDKAFGGFGGGGDSGTSARVLGTLITWMQEKTSSVFVVGTANSIDQLPPEMLRKGRFDEIFFVGLPTDRERKEIFEVHLRRVREHTLRSYALDRLVAVSAGFSGAEIQQAIVEGMHEAFAQEREFTTDDIIGAIRSTVPLSRTAQESVDRLKNWAASGRARPASREETRLVPGSGHPEWGPDEWTEDP